MVSRPGPVERTILDALHPSVETHRRLGDSISLRTLEGGSGQTIVFLHGRGHAATIWAPLLTHFVQSRQVVAIDLPGFGHSGSPPFTGSRAEDGLGYFASPVEDLIASDSFASIVANGVVLVGHSLGGLVALRIALEKKIRVSGLVLIGSMGLGPTMSNQSRLYLRSSPERIARFRAALPFRPDRGELDALRVELLTARGGRPNASAAFNAMVPLYGPVFHLRDRLADASVPTLLLWGEHDEAFPLPIAIDARARIVGAELRVLPTQHSPHVADPSGTIAAIDEWLNRTS